MGQRVYDPALGGGWLWRLLCHVQRLVPQTSLASSAARHATACGARVSLRSGLGWETRVALVAVE